MKRIYLLLIPVFILGCNSETSKIESTGLDEKISRIENGLQPRLQLTNEELVTFNIEERLRELGIPGISIALLNNGEIEWARAYGMADSSENRKLTPETMLLAGSISKPVSALRAHQLVEAGVIDLDRNVNDYLKSWKLPDNEFTEKEKVTTRRLLNMTAGLTVWGFPGYDKGDDIPSVQDVLDGKGNTDAVRVYKEPGESWMYSGGGTTIMQLMITDLEQQSFPDIMETNVLKPLGMVGSTFENPLPEEYHAIAATGYRSNGDEVEGKWPIYPEMAAAGLWTTPSELILWAKEIQNIQQNQVDGLLKVEAVNEMLTPGMEGHGLGPVISDHTYGHGGADEGFRANLMVWKDHPIAVVMMVNSDNGSIMQEVLLAIAEEYDLPGVEPNLRSPIELAAEDLEKYVGEYGIPDLGFITAELVEDQLVLTASFSEGPLPILPENDTTFFAMENGMYFNFKIVNDEVQSIGFNEYEGEKVK